MSSGGQVHPQMRNISSENPPASNTSRVSKDIFSNLTGPSECNNIYNRNSPKAFGKASTDIFSNLNEHQHPKNVSTDITAPQLFGNA